MDTDGYLRELYRIIDRMRHNLVLSRLPNLSPKVMIALLFIEENFASGVHLSDAARHVGMHPDSLSRKIHRELEGHDLYLTVPDYFNLLKAVKAREAITSDPLLLCKEVADLVGASPRELQRIFRIHFGSTLSEYREHQLQP